VTEQAQTKVSGIFGAREGETIPGTFVSSAAVWNQTRDLTANAKFIVADAIRDDDGQLTQVIDGRDVETRYEYDSMGREIRKTAAFGTSIAAKTETDYDEAGQVVEVRTPRYFDTGDTEGYQKCSETWTYNGRGV
jgi:YD repeat-containing protein